MAIHAWDIHTALKVSQYLYDIMMFSDQRTKLMKQSRWFVQIFHVSGSPYIKKGTRQQDMKPLTVAVLACTVSQIPQMVDVLCWFGNFTHRIPSFQLKQFQDFMRYPGKGLPRWCICSSSFCAVLLLKPQMGRLRATGVRPSDLVDQVWWPESSAWRTQGV